MGDRGARRARRDEGTNRAFVRETLALMPLVSCNSNSRNNAQAGHSVWRRCSSVKYAQYSPSSRLASRAPRQGLYSANYCYRTLGILVSMLCGLIGLFVASPASGQSTVSTVVGTGQPGFTQQRVANPYGVVIGPDGDMYFCDLDNQRIRRLDLETGEITTVAGNGIAAYAGDGGPATAASLNMPHEIQFDSEGHLYIVERDNHVVRRVDAVTGIISTVAGTGSGGFSGDGGPAADAELLRPHSIVFTPDGGLLICDIGNHRIRRVDPQTGVIVTFAGTGEPAPTPDGAPLHGTPLNGPRAMALDPDGSLYLALREGNAIYRLDLDRERIHHVAGTGEQGYAGDGGQAAVATLAGPKGLAYADGQLYIADTENHVIRRVTIETGTISTVLGTGERGDGPEPDPLQCKLNRPHGIWVDAELGLLVGDSEANRIRNLTVE